MMKLVAIKPSFLTVGEKDVYYGSKALIELEDAKALTVGQLVTMINWGNMRVNSVEKQGDTVSYRSENVILPICVFCSLNPLLDFLL